MKSFLPIAGLTRTFFMSLFTEAGLFAGKKNYHVVRIIANVVTFRKITLLDSALPRGIHITALVLHYALGTMFVLLYYWLREAGIINMTVTHDYLFGISIGLIVISGWRFFFGLHPGPPTVQLKYYLSIILVGHIILALVVMAYQTHSQPPIVEIIPIGK